MGRVKIDLPESFIFSTDIRVRIDDINYGGHLSNDAVLSIMHEARLRFLQKYHFSELDVGGASLIMADTAIVYKAEGFQGDLLQVEVTPADFSNFGFDLYYRLTNKEKQQEVAHAKTGMVCFDYESRKIAPVPDQFKNKFQ